MDKSPLAASLPVHDRDRPAESASETSADKVRQRSVATCGLDAGAGKVVTGGFWEDGCAHWGECETEWLA